MTFGMAIDAFVREWKSQERIATWKTELFYRDVLLAHAADVSNRDPTKVGREDVKRTLARWTHPNSRGTRRAVLVSFYRWMVEEGMRNTNPAEMVPRAKRRRPVTVRLTRDEAERVLRSADGVHETRIVYIAALLGLRNADMRRLVGRDFSRPGFVRVFGKGNVERWVPIPPEFEPVAAEIRANVRPGDYVLPGIRVRLNGHDGYERLIDHERPCSAQTVWRCVVAAGERAEIGVQVNAQMLRRAFGDYVARPNGLHMAQHLLGHSDPGTTERHYLSAPTEQELADAVRAIRIFRTLPDAPAPESPAPQGALGLVSYGSWGATARPRMETAGIEPASASGSGPTRPQGAQDGRIAALADGSDGTAPRSISAETSLRFALALTRLRLAFCLTGVRDGWYQLGANRTTPERGHA